MKMQNFGPSWVDFLILIVVLVGMVRGRKHGISQELIEIIKWSVIVVVAAVVYEPLGLVLSQATALNPLLSYVAVYSAVGFILFLIFAFIRRQIGDKLMNADKFGAGEYYLGMAAGAFRYTCIIIVAMSFIHARYYSPAELQAKAKAQLDVLGSDFFPSWGEFQNEVFKKSTAGRFTEENLPVLLIKSTPLESKAQVPGKKSGKLPPSRL